MTIRESFEEEIGFAELASKLRAFAQLIWNNRQTLLRFMALTGALGLFVALGSREEYQASIRLIPYRGAATGSSGLAGLAGLAGIRIPVGLADQTITTDLYSEVVKSQDFRSQLAKVPLFFGSLDQKVSSEDYFRTIQKPSITEMVYGYSVGLPGKIRYLLAKRAYEEPVPTGGFESRIPVISYNPEFVKVLNQLDERISILVDKKTSIVTIFARMPDPYAAADLVGSTANHLMEKVIYYESHKAAEQFRFASQQYQLAQNRYEKAQRALAIFEDRNRTLMGATSQLERTRLQGEVELSFEIYQQLSREVEQAKIKMSQDTPAFAVLEHVTVPNNRSSPNLLQILIIAVLFGTLAGVARIVAK